MLTEHQTHHLEAVIIDSELSKSKSSEVRKKEANAKEITDANFDTYLEKVQVDAQAILDSGDFPIGLEVNPADIHDFLEKNRKDI